MLQRLVRRSMAVSDTHSEHSATCIRVEHFLTCCADGYGHLILRVEFAKRAT